MEPHVDSQPHGKDFWEGHYGQADRVWSGKVNETLAAILQQYTPGTALDMGCGEGGDALWLASRGWQVTGVDISETAIQRATAAASQMNLEPGGVQFIAADLTTWDTESEYDLVTLSFFHAPFEFQRQGVLRKAMALLAPGGHLVLLSHGSHPASAAGGEHEHRHGPGQGPKLVTVDSELRSLGVPVDGFQVLQASSLDRDITGPDGRPTTIEDVVIVLRRAN